MKGYPFRIYSFGDAEADASFEKTFDYHTQQQQMTYLAEHEHFKTHGKKKTKNLRWALLFSILRQAWEPNSTIDNWSCTVSAIDIDLGDKLGDYCDQIMSKARAFLTEIQKKKEAGDVSVNNVVGEEEKYLPARI